MSLSTVLKQRRKELGLTLSQIADMMDVAEATVQRWESGNIKTLRHNKISKLAQILNVSPAYLMGWEEDNSADIPIASNIFPLPQTYRVPRIGSIACGTPILAAENIEEYDFVPVDIKCDFTLRCKGDSMIGAGINNGDVVYIRKQCTVENGQIAVVVIGEEATLKRFYHTGDMVQLVAENPTFPPMVFVGEEINQLRIAGRAIAYTHVL